MDSTKYRKLLELARTADSRGHSSAAYELWRRVSALKTANQSSIYRAVKALVELDRFTEAEDLLTHLKWNAAPKPWLIEFALGEIRLGQFRIIEAEKHFRNAARLNPKDADPAVLLAYCLGKQERLSEARDVLLRVVNASGAREEVYLNLALVERTRGNYISAKSYILEALAIDPLYNDAQRVLDDLNFWLDAQAKGS